MAYVNYAELVNYRGNLTDGDKSLIEELIDRVTAFIERYTDRKFKADSDTTRYFDADKHVDGSQLTFDEDIASITSITNGDSTTVASSNYVTLPRNETPYYGVKLLRSSGVVWTWTNDPEDAIQVMGKWGWSTTPPNDIKHATIRLVAYLYDQKDNAGELDRPIRFDGGMLLPAQLPKDLLLMLAPYRRSVG